MKTRYNKELSILIDVLQNYRSATDISLEQVRTYVSDAIELFELYKDEPDCNTDGLCHECEKIAASVDELPAE
jgi:hypothetical protein